MALLGLTSISLTNERMKALYSGISLVLRNLLTPWAKAAISSHCCAPAHPERFTPPRRQLLPFSADWPAFHKCGKVLLGKDPKSGQFSYYICNSLIWMSLQLGGIEGT